MYWVFEWVLTDVAVITYAQQYHQLFLHHWGLLSYVYGYWVDQSEQQAKRLWKKVTTLALCAEETEVSKRQSNLFALSNWLLAQRKRVLIFTMVPVCEDGLCDLVSVKLRLWCLGSRFQVHDLGILTVNLINSILGWWHLCSDTCVDAHIGDEYAQLWCTFTYKSTSYSSLMHPVSHMKGSHGPAYGSSILLLMSFM